jgi:hypothetical protein
MVRRALSSCAPNSIQYNMFIYTVCNGGGGGGDVWRA